MLSLRSDLFVGESLKEKYQKLLPRIEKGKKVKKGITVIAYAVNEKDLFDLIPAKEIKLSVRQEQNLYVLGLAGNRKEAFFLVQKMVMEVYQKTGSFDVRGYFGFE